jgi:peptide/nickel transport system ATP-binding protein
LFYNPKHPYTSLLLGAIPKMDQEEERLSSIQGMVPSLINMPTSGCRFANRCPMAMPECSTTTPLLAENEEGHEVACLQDETSKPRKEVR